MSELARKRVPDVLVDTLITADGKRLYGLVGDSLDGVTDSIRCRKELQRMPIRHEGTAAFAGFGRFMIKAVSSGDEIVDLAKVNLFR
jgi:thiamine pyrophosphate-dependent acetolactate synthase large subunit-like protein